jgi:hypothetical protein
MLKPSPIFKRNDAHLVEKKDVLEKKKDCPFSRFECFEQAIFFGFVSSFEHVNFAINRNYFKKHYENPNYYVSLVIFQTYKNAVLKSVHSLGWFF